MSQEEEKRNMLERKRNLLLLIARYLDDLGLVNTTEILSKECGLLTLNDHMLCDNVDLDAVYLDYMSYHHIKFGRYPKISKKINISSTSSEPPPNDRKSTNRYNQRHSQLRKSSSLRADMEVAKEKLHTQSETSRLNDSLVVTRCGSDFEAKEDAKKVSSGGLSAASEWPMNMRTLRDFDNYTADWKEMADIICRDIVQPGTLHTSWNSVKGLDGIRETLIESVITPLKFPALFDKHMIRPWSCILLFGPPGTGKTMIARALCSESCGMATFFNVSTSSIISKWRGESEKLIRVLFDVAKHCAPSIVFIDEVDGLMSTRDSSADHEASKRFKNELLTQIDGLEGVNNVFLLASTNLPWEIDPAFLRRFERKILLGLPDLRSRTEILQQLLPAATTSNKRPTDEELRELAVLTENFTGDDIRVAFKEASMNQIRQAINLTKLSSGDPAAHIQPVSVEHLSATIAHIKPASVHLMPKYKEWNNRNGNPVNK